MVAMGSHSRTNGISIVFVLIIYNSHIVSKIFNFQIFLLFYFFTYTKQGGKLFDYLLVQYSLSLSLCLSLSLSLSPNQYV